MPKRSRPRVALVLGGGGSKGSFQAGAIAALVDEWGLRPDILAGTSVGALNATALAHARTPDEYPETVERLLVIWRALRSESDMYVPRRWLADVPQGLRRAAAGGAADRFSAATVLELLRSAGSVRRIVRDFRSDGRSMLSLAPLEAGIRSAVEPARVAVAYAPLRLSVVELESGRLRWVGGDGTLYEEDATTVAADGPVALVDGVLASAAFAPAFAPRRMAGGSYADGGFRAVLPVRGAVALGADVVVAVACSGPEMPPTGSMADADVLRTTLRANAATFHEVGRRDVEDLRRVRSLLVEPSFEVHGFLQVDAGRIAIAMDQGAMTASERMAAVGGLDGLLASTKPGIAPVADPAALAASAALTDAVVRLRLDTWGLEETLAGSPGARRLPIDGANVTTLRAIRARKWLLRAAEAARAARPGPMPGGADAWWRSFETHREPLPVPDPWAGLSTVHGGPEPAVVPEAFTPLPFVVRERATEARWLVVDGRRRRLGPGDAPTGGTGSIGSVEVDRIVVELIPEA